MSIIKDIAHALAWKAHEAMSRLPGESVIQIETEVEKGFDAVDIGVEPPGTKDEEE